MTLKLSKLSFAIILSTLFLSACNKPQPQQAETAKTNNNNTQTKQTPSPATVEKVTVGSIKNVTAVGNTLLAGQPTEADFKLLKDRGIRSIINLRTAGETNLDEAQLAKSQGMDYTHLPVRSADDLTDELFTKGRELLKAHDGHVMMHCGGAVRVAPIWLAKRVLDDGVSWEQALAESKTVGGERDAYIAKVKAYIEKSQPAKK